MIKKQKDYVDLLNESPFYDFEEKLLMLTALASVKSKTLVQEKQRIKAEKVLLDSIAHKKIGIGFCVQVLLGYLNNIPSSLKQKHQKKAAAMFLLTLVHESPNLSAANRLFAIETLQGNRSYLFKTLPQKAVQVAEGIIKDEKAPLAYQRKAQIILSNNQATSKMRQNPTKRQ
ncbi:MAG: hypothetical protein K2Q34_01370 [Alphaproteobacteria bacterium]|nr:hypothetical protein [Alphaproteobacteria bacterium]